VVTLIAFRGNDTEWKNYVMTTTNCEKLCHGLSVILKM